MGVICCKPKVKEQIIGQEMVIYNYEGNQRYDYYEKIACGATSVVFKVYDLNESTNKICKRINRKYFRKAFREINILKKIQTSNNNYLLKLTDVINLEDYIKLIFPYYESIDLHYLFFDKQNIELKKIFNFKKSKIMNDMAICIREFQKFNLVHLDIKMENFIITINGQLKLIDYGTAHLKTNLCKNLSTVVGTKSYSAPEIYTRKYHNNSDIWSLGVCYWMMLFYCWCFDHTNIYKNNYTEDDKFKFFEFPNEYHNKKFNQNNDELKTFFSNIFKINPFERLSICEICEFKFNKYIDNDKNN